jgi:hypothetical protein
MRTTILALTIGALLAGAGCVSTVTEGHTAAVPFVKDKFEARYPRSVEQVFTAARNVVMSDGVLIKSGTVHMSQTSELRTIEGKVNQRHVWISVEAVDPNITKLMVQVRTSAGGTDIALASQLDKEIALKLTQPGN